MDTYDIGLIVKTARVRSKLTQKQLGELTGISTSMIASLESGYSKVSLKNARKIASCLHIDMNVLAGLEKPNLHTIDVTGLSNREITALEILVSELKGRK